MLKISEFSRLTRVPAKTLRYYDDIGLFQPAHVDRFTGYRYYGIEQLPRLYRILALKELGLALEQIKTMLDENLSVDQIRGMLKLKYAETMQRLAEEQQRLLYVEAKLTQLEKEGRMSEYEVVLKTIPVIRVASVRGIAPTMAALNMTLNGMFDTLWKYIETSKTATFSGKPEECGITLYHDTEWTGQNIQLEAALGISGELAGNEKIQVYDLPALEQVASVVHRGAFTTLGNAYDAISHWIANNGYTICGAQREINLKYDRNGDPSEWVTEIQFPVMKKA